MIEWLLSSGVPKELVVIITSALPILELRGALPIAINLFQMPWYWAFFLAIIGNLIPVPILLLFLDYLIKIISKVPIGEKMANWVLERTKARSQIIRRYERIGLIIFVAIPLPFTGAWTGAIAAFLLGIKFHHAFLAILCGLIIAGAVVTSLCLLGWIGAAIAGVGLCALAILSWWKI
jgi:uncharacterized membrane protein